PTESHAVGEALRRRQLRREPAVHENRPRRRAAADEQRCEIVERRERRGGNGKRERRLGDRLDAGEPPLFLVCRREADIREAGDRLLAERLEPRGEPRAPTAIARERAVLGEEMLLHATAASGRSQS